MLLKKRSNTSADPRTSPDQLGPVYPIPEGSPPDSVHTRECCMQVCIVDECSNGTSQGTSMRRQSVTPSLARAPNQELSNRIERSHLEAWVAEFHEMVTAYAAGQYPRLEIRIFCKISKARRRISSENRRERRSTSRELSRMSFKIGSSADGSRSSLMKSKRSGASEPKRPRSL
jgi:hypothetical protein